MENYRLFGLFDLGSCLSNPPAFLCLLGLYMPLLQIVYLFFPVANYSLLLQLSDKLPPLFLNEFKSMIMIIQEMVLPFVRDQNLALVFSTFGSFAALSVIPNNSLVYLHSHFHYYISRK